MIVFDLKCGHGHRFEAWFRDSATFEAQAEAGDIQCAVCGDADVTKALMAPNISTTRSREKAQADAGNHLPAQSVAHAPAASPVTNELAEKAQEALRQLREHVAKTHENVGEKFPEEVRKMHYGETEERPVYGEATLDEARELDEEGIAILPIGPVRSDA